VEVREHDSAEAFLAAASPLLSADEARHNLPFGICDTLTTAPGRYPVAHLWTVEDGNEVVAAALMTPPWNLFVGRPRSPEALDFLAEKLAGGGSELPGVTGGVPEADDFAEAWERLTGVRRRVRGRHGIYAVHDVQVPGGTPGAMRRATEADRDLLVEWMEAFIAEALPEAPNEDAEAAVQHRLEGPSGGLALWIDEEPVSVAGFGGQTPNGIRIGPVYTPPELRGRGYASAVTAELSAELLADGRSYCFLYTDLANPTSNRIYQTIGYEFVCDSAEYAFER
jgi:ribosomal protein S18 acetylase RimI-like enzyme